MSWLDRGVWAALNQGPLGTWSWPRAITTIAVAAVCGAIIYIAAYPQPGFLVGLAIAYLLVLYRARVVYRRYAEQSGSG